ncbi:DUF6731 family protein [Kinneretia aquatilis]|uniref:DUF6731 family protein n=1 Tax=Kinneretia aquatilis TaxID=2070761 RepID=UPI0025580BB6|nr:DUF6731 family protein [Paucibacter aquatile]WIV97486.1 hypothetical protein K9V56_021120 [Paucibacter aquatile]
MSKMSIHLFEIMSPTGRDLGALIDRIGRTGKDLRWRPILNQEIALLETRRDPATGFRFLDFVKRREVGPGKIRVNSDLEPFDFARGETFGEETAAIWDETRGWLAVQFNQHGVRAGSIANYFNSYDHDPDSDWILTAKLDERAWRELARRPNVKAATLRFEATDRVNSAMRESGIALGSALGRIGGTSGAANVEVTFTMGHTHRFLDRDVGELFKSLARTFGQDDGLRSVRLTARGDNDYEDKAIDLLHQRIKGGVATRELEVEALRFTLNSRWRAIERIMNGWIAEHE